MGSKPQKGLAVGEGVTGPEALLYIRELANSLREIAVELNHSHLAQLLGEAAAEAARLSGPD
ncbi:MAG TPA: hypothetical protein VGF56_06130 [Rhizomicrobium sp.]|jgi:hypothetical protein